MEALTNLQKLFISIAILIAAIALFTPSIYTFFFVADPLPSAVRSDFDLMDYRGTQIRNAADAAKASNKPSDLVVLSREYQTVTSEFNKLVSTAAEGIQLRRVDSSFLKQQFPAVESDSATLLNNLNAAIKIKGASTAEFDWVDKVLKFFNGLPAGWEKVLTKSDQLDALAIKDLNRMKWPEWNKL